MTDGLDILLITYNRKKELTKTMEALLSVESPVRRCSIRILDNCSTDGTSETLAEYAKKYANVIHIRHTQNIGGNANYVRAVELASKEYFWVLCDDDLLDWSAWGDVEEALLSGRYDLLQLYKGLGGDAASFPELTFIPGAIYRTSLIKGDVINSMYMHAYTMFPQLVLACMVYNKRGEIYKSPGDIVDNGEKDLKEYDRGADPKNKGGIGNILHQTDWLAGLCLALGMLEDKAFARSIIKDTIKRIYPRHEEFYYKYSPHIFDGYYWQFIGPVKAMLPLWDRLIFLWMMLLCRTKAGWWAAKGWRIFRTCLFNSAERKRYWNKLMRRDF